MIVLQKSLVMQDLFDGSYTQSHFPNLWGYLLGCRSHHKSKNNITGRKTKTTKNSPTGIIVGAFLGGKNVSTSISGSLEGLNTILKLQNLWSLMSSRKNSLTSAKIIIVSNHYYCTYYILLPCLNLCKTQWTIMFLISTCHSNVIMWP